MSYGYFAPLQFHVALLSIQKETASCNLKMVYVMFKTRAGVFYRV